jgi:S1-C subfamily serine protease
VARARNDGSLELSMGVNPGNSGGPVINQAGELVGVLTQRGDPRSGVANVAIAVPIGKVREARDRAMAALRREPVEFNESDRSLARMLARFLRTDEERPVFEREDVAAIQAAAAGARSPESMAIVALHAWNTAIAFLEERRTATGVGLPDEDGAMIRALLQLALETARATSERFPFMRLRYPALRAVMAANGAPTVHPGLRQGGVGPAAPPTLGGAILGR